MVRSRLSHLGVDGDDQKYNGEDERGAAKIAQRQDAPALPPVADGYDEVGLASSHGVIRFKPSASYGYRLSVVGSRLLR